MTLLSVTMEMVAPTLLPCPYRIVPETPATAHIEQHTTSHEDVGSGHGDDGNGGFDTPARPYRIVPETPATDFVQFATWLSINRPVATTKFGWLERERGSG